MDGGHRHDARLGGPAPLSQRVLCGGALIEPDRVLTAAHCLDGADPVHLEVHVGAAVLSREPGRVVPMTGWSLDPDFRMLPERGATSFTQASTAADAAVIELAHPVRDVPVLPLARHRPPPGAGVAVYGHGLTGNADPAAPPPPRSDVLRRGDMRILDQATCGRQAAATGFVIDDSVVCTTAPPGHPTTSACSGDSGGPLVARVSGRPEEVGIDSFTAGSGTNCGLPNGFTDLAKVRSFALSEHPVPAPMTTEEPRVVGTPKVGSQVDCALPAWTAGRPDRVEFQWYSADPFPDGNTGLYTIRDATAPTFTVTGAETTYPHLLCQVTERSAGGTVVQQSPVVPVAR